MLPAIFARRHKVLPHPGRQHPLLANKFIHSIRFWLYSPAAPAQATVFFAALLAGSMPLSPFMLSISMWGLVFVAFWHQAKSTRQAGKEQRA